MTSGGCSNFSTFYRNPYVLFSYLHSKTITLVLGHTTDQRHERTTTDVKLDYAQIGITIVQFKSHQIPTHDNYEVVCQSKFWNKREVSLTFDIDSKQGKLYAAVLSTYYPNIQNSFWVQVFSKQALPSVEMITWTNLFQQAVQSINGEWHRGNAGGRQNKIAMSTFYKNPAYRLTLSNASIVRIILHQSFGKLVPLAQYHPASIYVISTSFNEEPKFTRARSISSLVHLNSGEEYYIVPVCFEANSFGKFQLDVLSDVPFTLESTERTLPTSLVAVHERLPPINVKRTSMSPARKSINRNSMARRNVTHNAPERRSLSVAKVRLSSLIHEYTDKTS